ncbi:hypothetical protein TD95_000160 [Thielaviopsis punctulata]|uniref:MARVEL domain-containing protein n=1 Tax=Thielaviopsis punctulata TaxID=72032 RepID=A0A0F4Z7Y1_9PEZI|nr:hypothetical protein TD95_000160 [Thielaviopsis punctulata]
MIEIDTVQVPMYLLLLFIIIELGLTWGLVADLHGSAHTPNFMLFCSVWTIVVLIYLFLVAKYLPSLFKRRPAFYALVLTVIFWFSGSTALAVWVGVPKSPTSVQLIAQTGTAFGFFIWAITTLMLWRDWRENRRNKSAATFSSKVSSLGSGISSMSYQYSAASYSEA